MTDAAPLLPAVDLRPALDSVYSQSSANACTAHALVNALDCLHDRAGQGQRFSRAWIYWWGRIHNGRPGENIGLNADDFVWALQTKGAVLEADWPWAKVNTPPPALAPRTGAITVTKMRADLDALKRKLCLGMPVVACLALNDAFYALAGDRNWRTHAWDTWGLSLYGHAVCVVGYDDAAGRLLVENSWGAGWGDGGFFGIPYSDWQRVQMGCWTVDRIEGLATRPEENFVTVPYLLDPLDNSTFAAKNRERLVQMLTEAMASGGVPEVLNTCRRWHISDKHVEHLFRWDRGAVRAFQDANPSLDWADFPWAAL